MKLNTSLIVILALALVSGCSNTEDGLKKDASDNSQKTADQAQNLRRGAEEAGKDIGAATLLTPKVKMAITADKRLNDAKNLIDVSSTDDKVTLEGHVTSSELKTLAGEIAAKAVKDSNALQTIENKLEIKP